MTNSDFDIITKINNIITNNEHVTRRHDNVVTTQSLTTTSSPFLITSSREYPQTTPVELVSN